MRGDKPVSGDTLVPDLLSPEAGQQILRAYSAILEDGSSQPGRIADIGQLPYSKREIKDAIIVCLTSASDAEATLRLQSAYLALAEWQEGVGDVPVALTLLDVPAANEPGRPDQALVSPAARDVDQWNIRVVDERRQLSRELRALGFDTP